jgi:hypothetical protein
MQTRASETRGNRIIRLSKRGGLSAKKVLLTGVFGPFGVDDEYGRKENIMELFHNQVTREQGLASFRFQHRSFGLYFIAQNVDADVTVLDFPSKRRFEQEVKKGYDIVGISFIAPNFLKAREMARFVRANCPGTEIVLGGHGTAIEGIEKLIECDHIARGEGIRWLRSHLGQDPDAPIFHPALPSSERNIIHGVPVPGPKASLLVPGVGCVNACKFCCTTHYFGKAYTPFLKTGREVFETACRIADQRGSNEFFVMDENFLKDKQRAIELMEEMERHQRFFEFQIFSSAEAITAFGLDNLERLGVTYVWIGVESSSEVGNYAKNKGIDPRKLIREMRDRGIIVLASGILCMEHHTPENIDVDIDFMVGLQADFVQFMLLTPLPTTTLYLDHQARGLLRTDLPLEEWHGQKHLSWRHPAFPGDSAERWLKAAFRRDFEVNCSSMLRVVDTQWRGFRRLSALGPLDACLSVRRNAFEARLRSWSAMLPAIARHTPIEGERGRALSLNDEILKSIPPTMTERAYRVAVKVLSSAWKIRLRMVGDGLQPATILTHYPAGRRIMYSPGARDRFDNGSTRCDESGRWSCREAAATALASGGSDIR